MITVVGSINMDLVVSMKEIPKVGETVLGSSFLQNAGGKGANQAIAAAKLGSKVTFIGCIGDDIFGKSLKLSLDVNGVDIDYMKTEKDCSSGIALIQVDEAGQNNIVVIPGSNYAITKEDIDKNLEVFQKSEIVMLQMEIPAKVVQYVLEKAKECGCTTILNPAPACELSGALLQHVDILVPNEHELQRITNTVCGTMEGMEDAAKGLLKLGVGKVLVTMGEKGVFFLDKERKEVYPANKVEVVDTTAAGDAFLGGFVHYYEKSGDISASINYGQRVSAYAIQRVGAQQSLPSWKDMKMD